MSSLKSFEKNIFDKLFGLPSGYVLRDFTNSSFADFFKDFNIDIYNDKYSFKGNSKAKRLKAFWELEPDVLVGKVLEELLEIWQLENLEPDNEQKLFYEKAIIICSKLQGKKNQNKNIKEDFLNKRFPDLRVNKLNLESNIRDIIKNRINEAEICLRNNAPLSVIFLVGSILEGILLFTATNNQKKFNLSKSAPKDKQGKVKKFHKWTLENLINVAQQEGFIKLDVKRFSHELRKFRNYIHPYQQNIENFHPTKETAEICLQVLKAAISNLTEER